MIGYHFVIRRNGDVEKGRPRNAVGAHAQGWNDVSIGICLIGGVDHANNPQANFTDSQWESLRKLVDSLIKDYSDVHQGAPLDIFGHNEVASKACPCFDVREWYAERRANTALLA